MALSIIEIGIYGFVTYFCLALMLISIFQDKEIKKSLGGLRIGFLTIGVISAFLMAGSTNEIEFYQITTTTNTNSTLETALEEPTGGGLEYFTENGTNTQIKTETAEIILQNPMWVLFHIMIGFALIIYILVQAMTILTKPT